MQLNPAPIQEPLNDGGVPSMKWVQWFNLLRLQLNVAPTYTVAELPASARTGSVVFVSNEAGGTVLAFFDGTNWRRCTDRAIVS